jgi:DNA-directed RNA polymerase subunit beta
MNLTYNEKKRPRRSFASQSAMTTIPPLVQLQKHSYVGFLQKDTPQNERALQGLQNAFHSVFPIESSSGAVVLEFKQYELRDPVYTVQECKLRGLTYQASVYALIDMVMYDKKGGSVKETKEELVYMGELPLMTNDGSFVINGTERVVVSQLHRSPGVFFEHDSGRNTTTGKYLYNARVIPYSGAWLDFEFDKRDVLYFRIDRRRKMPVTILLKALRYTKESILRHFYEFEKFDLGKEPGQATYQLQGKFLLNVSLPFDICDAKGKVVVNKAQRIKKIDVTRLADSEGTFHSIPEAFLHGRRLAADIFSADGELLAKINAEIDEALLADLRGAGIQQLETLYINEFDCGPFIAQTLALDEKLDEDMSRTAIYRMLRPGDPPNNEVVNSYLDTVFHDSSVYDLSRVGRMKFNRRLYPDRPPMEYRVVLSDQSGKSVNKTVSQAVMPLLVETGCFADKDAAAEYLEYVKKYGGKRPLIENLTREQADKIAATLSKALPCEVSRQTTLSRSDVLKVVKYLVDLRNGKEKTDDIDSLSNRRVRAVGEFIENHYRQGLQRVNRAIRDRLSRAEVDDLMPHNLISAKAISSSVAEFFNGNQLSQFMDQTNPLSEITHKRRVSAFGVGGLNRDRVGFEVRDVHPSHYGRVCPIETPEGPNIGLINSMSLYASVNEYGFLQTPYVHVRNGVVTDKVVNLSAIDEAGCVIAPATSKRDSKGRFVDKLVSARRDGEYILCFAEEVDYIDVAPSQISSVAASLVPFIEHDDANRALMGSNMQRQGVPCLVPEKPLVGTGLERLVVNDSGSVIQAARGGVVSYVDSNRIAVRAAAKEIRSGESGVDIYNLFRHTRSNQNTDISHRPIVREGDNIAAGDVIADGSCTDLGELALGQNLLVAFLPWNGYNFEDSILISEKVAIEERFSSIHIIEEIVHARSTQLGDEEITSDIPHQSDASLVNLDSEGIVHVGMEVKPGDILVGKITPKGERQLTPEEKLLRAVFGEKAADVKDTSLRMPPGASGVVIDVRVFTGDEAKKKKKKSGSRVANIQDSEIKEFARNQSETLQILEEDAIVRIRGLVKGKKAAAAIGTVIKSNEVLTDVRLKALSSEQWSKIRVQDEKINSEIEGIEKSLNEVRTKQKEEYKAYSQKIREGHVLPQGILKTIKVYIAIKRNLQVGDKMAGRHGNKGVVSKIVPMESMPYLKDGTPVDVVLSPLGVPSRMNVGQILETNLGLAAKGLGNKITSLLQEEKENQVKEIRSFLGKVFKNDVRFEDKN